MIDDLYFWNDGVLVWQSLDRCLASRECTVVKLNILGSCLCQKPHPDSLLDEEQQNQDVEYLAV